MDIAYQDRIRLRAYEIWMAAGMNEGDADRHWLDAEQAVRESMVSTSLTGSPPVKVTSAAARKAGAQAGSAKLAKTKIVTIKVAPTKAATAKSAVGVAAAAPRRTKTVVAETSA